MQEKSLFALLVSLLLILLAVPSVQATTSIGVQPSILEVSLSPDYDRIVIPLRLWNSGDEDANFTLTPAESLKEFTDFTTTSLIVPKNTNRIDNYVEVPVVLKRTTGNKSVETGIYITGRPLNEEAGMMKIIPQVFMKIKVNQWDVSQPNVPPFSFPTPAPEPTSSSGGSSSPTNDTNQTIDNQTEKKGRPVFLYLSIFGGVILLGMLVVWIWKKTMI